MRSSGILMPIFSLPSPYGIGTLGKEARKFVDYLEKAGQKYWQILPISPTSYGDSPYASPSSLAGNPYFIDLEYLIKDKLLKKKECESYHWGGSERHVDYGNVYISRYAVLRTAFDRFVEDIPDEYYEFCDKEAWWLDDYSLFMALKDAYDGASWFTWQDEDKFRYDEALDFARDEYEYDIAFYKFLQYYFFKQWDELKAYANSKGIEIIGDVPIYVAGDSVDVWAHPEQFQLDKDLNPTDVAGCPPDAFSEDGQLWGNPLYRWDVMKEDGYGWWAGRIEAMARLYDIIRIDHFRGFDSYYAIPYGDENAKRGEWREGPGMDLFNVLESKFGRLPIIVEDLGYLTPSVKQLLKDSGFPGMKVTQFAFDNYDNDYQPHNYDKHCVAYTGTHDNDTCLGWIASAPKKSVELAKLYLNLTKEEGYNWGMMRGIWASSADMAIVTMQDIIGLGSETRLNAPSTVGENWKWRATAEQINSKSAARVRKYVEAYGRLNVVEKDEQ